MKKLLSIIAVMAIMIPVKLFAQDSQQQKQLSLLLTQYYSVKNALVASNNDSTAQKAEQLVKTLNSIDYKVVSEGNINAILKDATTISESKDLKVQRASFSNLSNNMISLAKAMKLSDQPVYLQYCPMKKASWLSSEQAIKNPYYGNMMLTCGKVVETIK